MASRLGKYSGIFSYFSGGKPDRTGSILEKIGVFGFATFLLSVFILRWEPRNVKDSGLLFDFATWSAFLGYGTGILMFIAVGIHYTGRELGRKNFFASAVYAIGKVFLYLLLPTALIVMLLMIWLLKTYK